MELFLLVVDYGGGRNRNRLQLGVPQEAAREEAASGGLGSSDYSSPELLRVLAQARQTQGNIGSCS